MFGPFLFHFPLSFLGRLWNEVVHLKELASLFYSPLTCLFTEVAIDNVVTSLELKNCHKLMQAKATFSLDMST